MFAVVLGRTQEHQEDVQSNGEEAEEGDCGATSVEGVDLDVEVFEWKKALVGALM
jgi:hypothetical protein